MGSERLLDDNADDVNRCRSNGTHFYDTQKYKGH